MVIRLPPSIVVSALMVFWLVTVIVAAPPQLKVTVPLKLLPPGRQASNAASAQRALVPVPTTQAKADEVTNGAKTSSAKTDRRRVPTIAVFIVRVRPPLRPESACGVATTQPVSRRRPLMIPGGTV